MLVFLEKDITLVLPMLGFIYLGVHQLCIYPVSPRLHYIAVFGRLNGTGNGDIVIKMQITGNFS
jgi:hypothetical protein